VVVCGVVGKVGGKLVLLSEFENQADFPCSLHGLEFGWGFGLGLKRDRGRKIGE